MRAVIFFHENDHKQTEVATVRFADMSVAFSYKLTHNITGLIKAKMSQKSQ